MPAVWRARRGARRRAVCTAGTLPERSPMYRLRPGPRRSRAVRRFARSSARLWRRRRCPLVWAHCRGQPSRAAPASLSPPLLALPSPTPSFRAFPVWRGSSLLVAVAAGLPPAARGQQVDRTCGRDAGGLRTVGIGSRPREAPRSGWEGSGDNGLERYRAASRGGLLGRAARLTTVARSTSSSPRWGTATERTASAPRPRQRPRLPSPGSPVGGRLVLGGQNGAGDPTPGGRLAGGTQSARAPAVSAETPAA